MDPQAFAESLRLHAGNMVGKLYNYDDLPRKRVYDVLTCFEHFMQQEQISKLFRQMIIRLKDLGEAKTNLEVYESMTTMLQTPFYDFRNEYQTFQYFKSKGTFFPPEEVTVTSSSVFSPACPVSTVNQKTATIQFIPLRLVLVKFFELPGLFHSVISYLEELDKYKSIISNLMQGEVWKSKKALYNDKFVLPMLLYQDDFENNNPLGSHRGVGKVGAIYVVIPCLPPQLRSKTDNIFLLTLYKAKDQDEVSLESILSRAVQELVFLLNNGIEIATDSGPKRIHFLLIGVIGDNLAVHLLLGFIRGFSANHPCRFCLISKEELTSIFDESLCEIRTQEMYERQVQQCNPKETGVERPSALGDSFPMVMDIMTIDIMHDTLEGSGETDLGNLMHHFIMISKYFTLDQLNQRIRDLDYGIDEGSNKPREITIKQIRDKHIKMSAAESLCLIRNLGILVGQFVPEGDNHWKLVMKYKQIIDIITAPQVYESLSYQLQSLISDYLSFLTSLFPGCMKPKHHYLVHYPSIMRRFGPLRQFSTMRCESKNRTFKVTSHTSGSRVSICKTLAIREQLRLNYRLQQQSHVDDELYEIASSRSVQISVIENITMFYKHLMLKKDENVLIVKRMTFHGKTIQENTVIAITNNQGLRELFIVYLIIATVSHHLLFVIRNVTSYTFYDEHYQAYKPDQNYTNDQNIWQCLRINDVDDCSISRIAYTSDGIAYILKRWI